MNEGRPKKNPRFFGKTMIRYLYDFSIGLSSYLYYGLIMKLMACIIGILKTYKIQQIFHS